MSKEAKVSEERLQELKLWLERKWNRHHEEEDLEASHAIAELLHLRTLSPAAQGDAANLILDDGFGGRWQKCGRDCSMEIVRPGKVQCQGCDYWPNTALSTDTTEQPRSVQRRIAAQNGLPVPDFSAPAAGWWETPMQMCICADPENCTEVPEGRICKRATPAPAEQAGDEELTSGAKETLEALDDAAAFFRKEAIYECENMGAGGSSIALGRWKRYYNAIENVAHDIRHPGRSLSAPPLDAQKADTTQARDAWQPIETAPRDGRSVLLGYPGFVTEGYWDCGSKVHLICGLNSEPLTPFTHWHKFPASPAPYAAIAKETTK